MADTRPNPKGHFYLSNQGNTERFTSPSAGGGGGRTPERNRANHAGDLQASFNTALAAAEQQRAAREPNIVAGTPGFYLEIDVSASNPAIVENLEARQGKSKIELLTVRPSEADPTKITATLFVPDTKSDHYSKRIDEFADPEKDNYTYEKNADKTFRLDANGNQIQKSRRPKNNALIASIEAARLGQVRSFFTDAPATYPETDTEVWWEVWLRNERQAVFTHTAEAVGMTCRESVITFAERDVLLARGTARQLGRIVANTDAIAELRLAKDTPSPFILMDGAEQHEWSDDFLARITPPGDDAPAVCILDSGTTHRHPLIRPALNVADQQQWQFDASVEDVSTNSWGGHGTQMSGLALYGDLTDHIYGQGKVTLTHRLESIKILPDFGANVPELYGYITASAVSLPEIQASYRERAFCLAITSSDTYLTGRPSSWSARLDELAYGEGESQRFIAVSAGNIRNAYPANEYMDQNDSAAIENPAQAWNVLTVGAFTEKLNITDPALAGWQAVNAAGDLSPASRTSLTWSHDWPLKPDVVFEGGNYAVDPDTGKTTQVDDLGLLTTFRRPEEAAFSTSFDTSAATANASRMAAQIMAAKPGLWPETVRALIIQSADWTPRMRARVPDEPSKAQMRTLTRRYGFGVPSLARAMSSVDNDVSLVIEREITPFVKEAGGIKTNEMIFHELPWPAAKLTELENTPVE
ncbi:MAG: S8 family peptidase, partial [Rhodobacteraceae bacterium]|nr:S8 family peptidase [Paracoccaceae bacterium]